MPAPNSRERAFSDHRTVVFERQLRAGVDSHLSTPRLRTWPYPHPRVNDEWRPTEALAVREGPPRRAATASATCRRAGRRRPAATPAGSRTSVRSRSRGPRDHRQNTTARHRWNERVCTTWRHHGCRRGEVLPEAKASGDSDVAPACPRRPEGFVSARCPSLGHTTKQEPGQRYFFRPCR